MRPTILVAALLIALPVVAQAQEKAQDKAPVVVTLVARTMQTIADQPIRLPQKDVEVIVSTYDIAPGAALPVHKHHYQRYAYVLAGTLIVSNIDSGKDLTFKAGDFIVESLDSWHKGTSIGTETVKLLVIDQVEKGGDTVTLKD